MDMNELLQRLRQGSLEEGRQLIVECAAYLSDQAASGIQLADEALEQLYVNPAVSLKLAEILTFYGEHIHHLSSNALGLKAKGDALRAMGFHQKAIDNLDESGAKFLQLGDEGNWARSRISWILAAAWLGRVDEALQEAKKARETFVRLGELYWACVIDSNTALVYNYIGRYQASAALYKQIIAVYLTLADQNDIDIKRQIAIAECNHAIQLTLLGRFEDAYQLYQKARTSFIELNETSFLINVEMNLAELDYILSYYGLALYRYYNIVDVMTKNKIDEPPLLVLLKLWMANCFIKLSRFGEALQIAEEALAIQKKLDGSLEISKALCEYATTLVGSGKLQEALIILDEAEGLFSQGKFRYYAAITALQRTEVLLEMGCAAMAYKQACILKEYFDAQCLIARSIRVTLIMAEALIAIGQSADIERAIKLCKNALMQARQHNLQEEVYKGYHLLGRLLYLQGDLIKAKRYYKASIAQVERILECLTFDLSSTFLHTTWKLYEDMIALCLQRSQFDRAFSYLEQARSTALRQHLRRKKISQEHIKDVHVYGDATLSSKATDLRLQQELNEWQERYRQYSALLADTATLEAFAFDQKTIEQALRNCEAKLSELFERQHLAQTAISTPLQRKLKVSGGSYFVDIAKLRQQLEPNQCLLAYFIHKEKLVVFILTAESLITQEVSGATEHLERLLPLLYAHLDPAGWSDVQHPPQNAIRRLLQKLYNLLITSIVNKLLPHIDTLTIVPYGMLHGLPFHALYDGSQFLIERFQVSYLPASSLLSSKDHQKASSLTTSNKAPLVLGYAGNGNAHRTLDEANMLSQMLEGECYLEQDATIAHLIAEASGRPLIHIATHGRARLDAPHFSSVLLADGQFNAIDAFQLDVKECQLVTLSGCETGKSLIGGGDEQLGLGRAFLAAGAKSLVMSLWPVEDEATNILMQCFYQGLLRGETKAEALRNAQCSLLQQSSLYAHPYFWAAFRLVGDTHALSLPQKYTIAASTTQNSSNAEALR